MFLGAADNNINSTNYWLPETELNIEYFNQKTNKLFAYWPISSMLGNTKITLIPFRYLITNNHCLELFKGG